jgi:hypothetical protein
VRRLASETLRSTTGKPASTPERQRLDDDLDPRELAGAAGVLLVGEIHRRRPRDRLAIGDLQAPILASIL